MNITLECISCILRRSFQTCQILGLDDAQRETVARQILKLVAGVSYEQTSGHVLREVHRLIRELSKVRDPYDNVKSYYTDLALRAYPELKETVEDAEDRFLTAVRVALAGSTIDYVFDGKPDIVTLFNGIESVLSRRLALDHIRELKAAVKRSRKILYLADNAGETVFDRILIEELPAEKLTYVVKGAPIMNDATMMDARFAGITDLVEVIDNGSDAPGTILETCSLDFRSRFRAADLIISKGQANYETLGPEHRPIFFLFRVKCSNVARRIGCDKNELVVFSFELDRERRQKEAQSRLEQAS